MNVRLLPYNMENKKGIDIVITNEMATVEDYLDELEKYIETCPLDRLRANVSTCVGCEVCCQERMPLTNIDKYNLAAVFNLDGSEADFYNKYTKTIIKGRNIDIVFANGEEGKCILLDSKNKLCTRYKKRPFVCRTYICCPVSERAERLRQELVNSGEDALVAEWIEKMQKGEVFIYELGEEADIRPEDWKGNGWTGKDSFAKVYIKEVISEKLWEEIFERGKEDV